MNMPNEELLLAAKVTPEELEIYKASMKIFFKIRNAQARLAKIDCACGKSITYVNRKKHYNSKIHLKALSEKAQV